MQTSERFRLREAITAVHKAGVPQGFVTVPTGSIVTIVDPEEEPKAPEGFVDICWDQQQIWVFLQDLRERGDQVSEN